MATVKDVDAERHWAIQKYIWYRILPYKVVLGEVYSFLKFPFLAYYILQTDVHVRIWDATVNIHLAVGLSHFYFGWFD